MPSNVDTFVLIFISACSMASQIPIRFWIFVPTVAKGAFNLFKKRKSVVLLCKREDTEESCSVGMESQDVLLKPIGCICCRIELSGQFVDRVVDLEHER
jgi:hypothetical protein